MEPTKVCTKCGVPKAYSEFHKDAGHPTGRKPACKACRSERKPAPRPSLKHGPNLAAFDAATQTRRAFAETWEREVEALKDAAEDITMPTGFEAASFVHPGPGWVPPHIEHVPETITEIEEHRLKKRVRDLEEQNRKLIEQLSDGGEYAEVVKEVLAHQHEAPPARIAPRERTSGLLEGTPLVLASDWHVEEEVRPEQVAGRNRYNLDIAVQRMQRFAEAAMWGVRQQRDTFKIRSMIAWWGGDFLTNFLHEDDVENNQLAPNDTILFLLENHSKIFDFWLTDPELDEIIVPMNDGNHGRTTKKMRNATRMEHSLEVFLYALLADKYKHEKRLKFILPTSQFTFMDDVYGRTIRFLHGDVFKYAGGVGGIFIPLMKALARWERVMHADLTCMGHWHQRVCLPDTMVNGSLIGYNAYAMGGGFPFEPPVQSMRMLDSKRWCSSDIPLWVAERSDDDANKGRP